MNVEDAGVDPFSHYLLYCEEEGRVLSIRGKV